MGRIEEGMGKSCYLQYQNMPDLQHPVSIVTKRAQDAFNVLECLAHFGCDGISMEISITFRACTL